MAHIMCILAFLCFALYIAENTETDHDFEDLQRQQSSFPWSDKSQNKQELTETQNFVDLLYKLLKTENGIIHKVSKDTDTLEKYRRGLGSGNATLPQRGPGCRVFFWKSWTAC